MMPSFDRRTNNTESIVPSVHTDKQDKKNHTYDEIDKILGNQAYTVSSMQSYASEEEDMMEYHDTTVSSNIANDSKRYNKNNSKTNTNKGLQSSVSSASASSTTSSPKHDALMKSQMKAAKVKRDLLQQQKQARNDVEISKLILEEIRLKAYLENYHQKHIHFLKNIKSQEEEIISNENRYETGRLNAVKEISNLIKQHDKVDGNIKMYMEKYEELDKDCIATTRILRNRRKTLNQLDKQWLLLNRTIIDDKKTLSSLSETIDEQINKIKYDIKKLKEYTKSHVKKIDGDIRHCEQAHDIMRQSQDRWIVLWPMLHLWDGSDKNSNASRKIIESYHGTLAEWIALRDVSIILKQMATAPTTTTSSADSEPGSHNDAVAKDEFAPFTALYEDTVIATEHNRSMIAKLTEKVKELQVTKRRYRDLILELKQSVENDCTKSIDVVSAAVNKAADDLSMSSVIPVEVIEHVDDKIYGNFSVSMLKSKTLAHIDTSLIADKNVSKLMSKEDLDCWKWYKLIEFSSDDNVSCMMNCLNSSNNNIINYISSLPVQQSRTVIGGLEVKQSLRDVQLTTLTVIADAAKIPASVVDGSDSDSVMYFQFKRNVHALVSSAKNDYVEWKQHGTMLCHLASALHDCYVPTSPAYLLDNSNDCYTSIRTLEVTSHNNRKMLTSSDSTNAGSTSKKLRSFKDMGRLVVKERRNNTSFRSEKRQLLLGSLDRSDTTSMNNSNASPSDRKKGVEGHGRLIMSSVYRVAGASEIYNATFTYSHANDDLTLVVSSKVSDEMFVMRFQYSDLPDIFMNSNPILRTETIDSVAVCKEILSLLTIERITKKLASNIDAEAAAIGMRDACRKITSADNNVHAYTAKVLCIRNTDVLLMAACVDSYAE